MKARLPVKLTRDQQIAVDREVRKHVVEVHAEYQHALDVAIAYTLHTQLGFGEKRLRDFFNAVARNQITIRNAYSGGSTDDAATAIYAMERKLSDAGINLQQLLDDMNSYAAELNRELKNLP